MIEESPRIEVPNEQILKDQYNNLPECRYQPDITLAYTIIHLLEKTMIACRPYYFQKNLIILSQNTFGQTLH